MLITCNKEEENSLSDTIIDHRCTDLSEIPIEEIARARANLRIAYWHSNIGSQILYGMDGLVNFRGSPYDFSENLEDSVLFLTDEPIGNVNDMGNPGDTEWETATRSFLSSSDTLHINVIMWSWGNHVNNLYEEDIKEYLDLMSGLEEDYANVKFVYMTIQLDGKGLSDPLYLRNEQIRKYCRENKKFLYDFADIESYDPEGNYYGDKRADNACNYDADNDGVLEVIDASEETNWQTLPDDGDLNWAIEWQNSHRRDFDWYECNAPGSQPLNANLKAYAAWWLWARLAGWDGK